MQFEAIVQVESITIKYILHSQSIFQALDFCTVETTFSQTRWDKDKNLHVITESEQKQKIICRERTVWRAVRGEKKYFPKHVYTFDHLCYIFCRSFNMLCRLVMNMYLAVFVLFGRGKKERTENWREQLSVELNWTGWSHWLWGHCDVHAMHGSDLTALYCIVLFRTKWILVLS